MLNVACAQVSHPFIAIRVQIDSPTRQHGQGPANIQPVVPYPIRGHWGLPCYNSTPSRPGGVLASLLLSVSLTCIVQQNMSLPEGSNAENPIESASDVPRIAGADDLPSYVDLEKPGSDTSWSDMWMGSVGNRACC